MKKQNTLFDYIAVAITVLLVAVFTYWALDILSQQRINPTPETTYHGIGYIGTTLGQNIERIVK